MNAYEVFMIACAAFTVLTFLFIMNN